VEKLADGRRAAAFGPARRCLPLLVLATIAALFAPLVTSLVAALLAAVAPRITPAAIAAPCVTAFIAPIILPLFAAAIKALARRFLSRRFLSRRFFNRLFTAAAFRAAFTAFVARRGGAARWRRGVMTAAAATTAATRRELSARAAITDLCVAIFGVGRRGIRSLVIRRAALRILTCRRVVHPDGVEPFAQPAGQRFADVAEGRGRRIFRFCAVRRVVRRSLFAPIFCDSVRGRFINDALKAWVVARGAEAADAPFRLRLAHDRRRRVLGLVDLFDDLLLHDGVFQQIARFTGEVFVRNALEVFFDGGRSFGGRFSRRTAP
jgi:hypothetical protein